MSYGMTLLFLALGLAALVASAVGALAGILSKLDGASYPTVISRAGIAFGGTLTLAILIITLIAHFSHLHG